MGADPIECHSFTFYLNSEINLIYRKKQRNCLNRSEVLDSRP